MRLPGMQQTLVSEQGWNVLQIQSVWGREYMSDQGLGSCLADAATNVKLERVTTTSRSSGDMV